MTMSPPSASSQRFSFVELKADQAERAVEFLDGTKLKGKEIRLEIAKK